jgi:predicted acylesterase/phospholipase RssA
VLCVDGGGARGVVPLAVLAECERETRTSIRDQFDLFAGTSTGAIVAFGLAIAELPVAVLQRLYDDLVRLIFGSKNLNAQQRQRRLQAVLEAVFGADSTLHGRKRSRRALAVATDASTARLRPFVFRSFAPVWKSKFYGAFVPHRRVDLHAIDAMPARPRHRREMT